MKISFLSSLLLSCALLSQTASAAPPKTGWWWNPAEGGRGFTIEQQGTKMFMAGYLYDTTGRATWYAAGPDNVSENVFTSNLIEYRGGQTMTGAWKLPASTSNVGKISIDFTTPTTATVTWPGGTLALQRYDIVAGGSTANVPATTPEAGWWWNSEEGGRGFSIEIQNGTMFLAGYMYDSMGNPTWYASGPTKMVDASTYEGTWQEYGNGQTMTGSYVLAQVVKPNVGKISIKFSSPTQGVLTLPDSRQIPIVRYIFDNGTAPVVTNLAHETPMYGKPTLFRVDGENLQNGITMAASGCTDPVPVDGGTSAQQFFRCIPSQTGTMTVSVSASTGGAPLLTGTVTVPEPQVTMKTPLGDYVLELNPAKAPVSVLNFLQYVKDGFYSGKYFHRITTKAVAGYGIIQGGAFNTVPFATDKATRAPINYEASNLSHVRGTIGMARTSDPNSATSQFFINVSDNAWAFDPGGYTVFGKVVSGMSVVDALNAVPTYTLNGYTNVPQNLTQAQVTSASQTR